MRGEAVKQRVGASGAVVSAVQCAVPAVRVIADVLQVGFCAEGRGPGVGIEDAEALSAVEACAGADFRVSVRDFVRERGWGRTVGFSCCGGTAE